VEIAFEAQYPDEQIPGEGVEVICIEPETESILGRSRLVNMEQEESEDEDEGFTSKAGQSQGSDRNSVEIITLDEEGEDGSNGDEESGADFMGHIERGTYYCHVMLNLT